MDNKKTCGCGNSKKSSEVELKTGYSTFGWILFYIGMSARPVKAEYICKKCGEIIESIADPVELKKYVGK
jgi:hypothetical protein